MSLPNLDTLSLRQQVAQMVVVRASGYLFDHQIQYPAWEPTADKLQHWLQLGVGGVILLGGSAAELVLRSQQLQGWATIPLLIAADVEEGVGQRFAGATWFPPLMALGTIAARNLAQALHYTEEMGAATAQEALAIGLNWLLAPVVDVNNNPANPVINVRAFSEDAAIVSQLAQAFIRGVQRYPVLTTAKHFPGHGDTTVDSHLALPVLPHTPGRLDEVELPPFRAAIEAGVDAVMTAHLTIPAWDEKYPATLSPHILTQELRQNLAFPGLIVTDALVMGAIADRYGNGEAAVLAVEAGADILLMPLDPEDAIQAVCEAVAAGRITPERIRASVERIWQGKRRVDLPIPAAATKESTPAATQTWGFLQQLAQPAATAMVETILRDSMAVRRPEPSRLENPVWTKRGMLRNLIVLDDALTGEFLGPRSPAITLPTERGYRLHLVDRHTPEILTDLEVETQIWYPTLLQVFVRGNPFRGGAGLTQTAKSWFHSLLQTQELQALVIYGSPYILKYFLPELSVDVPYVFTYGQMPIAQSIALTALFGGDR